MTVPRHILVFRFSALGDIAMTVPVLRCLLQQHAGLEVTIVSVPFVKPLFDNIPRLHFIGADIRGQYNGIHGLWRLSRQLKKDVAYDAVADLHDVLRTKLLRQFCRRGPLAVIDKGRKEKKELTRSHNKILRQLPTMFERHAKVFAALKRPVQLNIQQGVAPAPAASAETFKTIGIAPFAKHAAKMYPLDDMKEVVKRVAGFPDTKVLLFGSKHEASLLEEWAAEIPGVKSLAGKISFAEELAIIAHLKSMISMDSANMHLASLYGVPVVSIWGGTHPYLGFYGWGQDPELAVQIDHPSRPSSVFGNKPCEGCMEGITPALIAERVYSII
ncbi:glycosyltransferase family 9 protein [Nostoc ellipsosporum NOK]|nr:glycosyltransferase family 9 protein [Nostoc ellipsosporum NOK]